MSRRFLMTLAGAVFFPGIHNPALTAQTPETRLGRPEATLAEGFGLIRGVRERPDGRVLIADPLGQVLVMADLDRGTTDTLSRVGAGPDEYRQPDGLFPLPGDSTLLVDLGNSRLTVLGPDGSFGPTMPITQGEPTPGRPMQGLTLVLPRAVDARGRIYFQSGGGVGRGGAPPDSAPVVRWDRTTGTMDTVALVKLQDMTTSTSGGRTNQQQMVMPVPLSPQDAWAVAPDGRVAVVRAGDYHVEWIAPGGRVVRGTPVRYRPVRIVEADREQWLERLGNGLRISMTVENGRSNMSMNRGGESARPDPDRFEWPRVKPPFTENGTWVTPTGELWVERHVRAGEPPALDVFDQAARLVRQIVLPVGRHVVGFGRGTVYLVATDDVGLQRLERYRMQ